MADARQPYRSRIGGAAVLLLALLCVGAALAWGLHAWRMASDDRDWGFDAELIGALLLAAGVAFRIGRELLAPAAETVLAHDRRKPVVYLRPFDEDTRRNDLHPVGNRIGGRKLMENSAPASRERSIAHALSGIGPFVAVGAPGDMFAPLGAARLYLTDDTWQAKVEALVRGAAAVVLTPETSEGTRWEVSQVARWLDPRRVIVIVPNPALRPLGYARIQGLTAETLPKMLPHDCVLADAFLFDEHSEPKPLVFGRNPRTALAPFIAQLRALDGAGA